MTLRSRRPRRIADRGLYALGAATALAATWPLVVTAHTPADWVSRGIFFAALAAFVARLVHHQRRRDVRERLIGESERRFRSLVQRAADMITVADVGGRILYDSPAVERVLGWRRDERLGRDGRDFLHEDDRPRADAVLADVIAHPNRAHGVELRHRDRDGAWHWVEATVTNLVDEPSVGGLVVNYRVVDERKALEEQLAHRALHDTLTRLANRALFEDRLHASLSRRDIEVHRPAVLFVDVDDFKTVNDGFGHEAGDALLVEVAERLRRCVRGEDVVARLGGDEFAILLTDPEPVVAAIEVAERVLDSISRPFAVAGRELGVGVSIGISCHERGASDAEKLLRQADTAMYRAKGDGKARFSLYSEAMDELVRRRAEVESGLRAGIDRDQIRVHYQPIVALEDGRITALEALVRWHHPTRGVIPPSEFLTAAEETGLILPIGRLVIAEACRQLRAWQDIAPQCAALKVNVNLSAKQLRSDTIVEDVATALMASGITPESLVIEVNESSLSDDSGAVAQTLRQLKELGVLLAVDNFGTGSASLSRIAGFALDVLKVDRSLVEMVGDAGRRGAMVRAVFRIADELGLGCVAEGVEDAARERELRRLGCTHVQGYYYSRPHDATIIAAMLAADGAGVRAQEKAAPSQG